jgi:hypothetical protein
MVVADMPVVGAEAAEPEAAGVVAFTDVTALTGVTAVTGVTVLAGDTAPTGVAALTGAALTGVVLTMPTLPVAASSLGDIEALPG